MNIPLIIPVFNQLTYLKNIINWWRWYHPVEEKYPIYIIDNGSNYQPLVDFYKSEFKDGNLHQYSENKFIPNMKDFLNAVIHNKYEYYVISDPDIMPHPATPPNFLEIWMSYINTENFHRVGFNLIISDLPQWLNNRDSIIYDETEIRTNSTVKYENWQGNKAPIDTTFCLYKTSNGGWDAPMDGNKWSNCLRLFHAFHLGWYVHGDYLNPEMENYFKTANYFQAGQPSAGKNNNRPAKFNLCIT